MTTIVSIDSFYRITFYPITYILSPFSTYHIPSYLGSRVDMISNLDPVSMIFCSLFNNYFTTSAKCLCDSTINIHKNYSGFYIGSALRSIMHPHQVCVVYICTCTFQITCKIKLCIPHPTPLTTMQPALLRNFSFFSNKKEIFL